MSRNITFSALLLAFLFEALIFAETPGLGYPVFWLVVVGTTLVLLKSAERLNLDRVWMFLPSLLMSFAVFRYDADVVRVWGAGLGLLFLAWAVAWNLVPERTSETLARFLPKDTWNPGKLGDGASESLKVECRWDRETVVQVVRGLLFGAFLLLVFGTLLAQADAVFGSKMKSIGQIFDYMSPASIVRLGFWMMLFAGLLKVWVLHDTQAPPQTRSFFSPTEMYISLGSLNLLLASFLLIQARYLFGDSSLVEQLGFSHAHYARRGFFELTICIALILPLVLVAYRAAEVNKEGKLRYLGGGLILSALGLAASAMKRMMLYIDVYGLSVERFYAAAGILVALTTLAWAAFVCLKPQSVNWLLARQKMTVIVCLSVLSLVNVDMLVARSHLQLVESSQRDLDSYYLGTLSTDILPVLERYRKRLKPAEARELVKIREKVLRRGRAAEWSGLNISRSQIRNYPPPKLGSEAVSSPLERETDSLRETTVRE